MKRHTFAWLPIAGLIILCSLCISFSRLDPQIRREQSRVTLPAPSDLRVGMKDLGTVRVAFERNQGQADRRARFVLRNPSMALLVSNRGVTLGLASRSGDDSVVAIDFKQSMTKELVGETELRGRSHYLIGNRAERWVRNVARYEKVRYRGLYPGIDASIYVNGGNLEYDFVVAPGADAAELRLGFRGVKRLWLDSNGDLHLKTSIGDVLQRKPIAYQRLADKRSRVDVGYAITGREVSFRVGQYDRTKELVIDPILVYATLLGGSGDRNGPRIAVDAAGAAYIAGTTTSLQFPATAGSIQPHHGGGDFDAFVAKLNPQGTDVDYVTYLGGSGFDFANGLSVDKAGNAYISGRTESPNFPGSFLTASGNLPALPPGVTVDQAFVTKLNAAGSAILYSVRFGGNDVSQFPVGPNGTVANAVAIDSDGNAYVTGMTGAVEFPVTAPIVPGTPFCDRYGICTSFVTKINTAGTALVYSSLLGGGPGLAIAVDSTGNAFVAGRWGPEPTPNAVQNDPEGAFSIGFVSKINSSGTALVYSARFGGTDQSSFSGVAIDGEGNAYVTGSTSSPDFTTTAGAFIRTRSGGYFVPFVSKLNPTGTELLYSTYLISALGGAESYGESIAIDSFGNAYVVGETDATTLAVTPDAVQKTHQGTTADPYLVKLNSSGSGLLYATYFGGTADVCCNSSANSVALDGSGNAYMAGVTSASDFPATPEAFQTKLPEKTSNFMAKFAVAPDFSLSASPQSATVSRGQSAKYQITVSPQYGFDGQVNLACSGLPAGASCSFDPPSVSAGSTVSSTLTIATTTVSASGQNVTRSKRMPAAVLLPFGMILLSGTLLRKTTRQWLWLAVAIILVSVLLSCGGTTRPAPTPSPNPSPSPSPSPTPTPTPSPSPTPTPTPAPGNYGVVITGSSAGTPLQHSATVQLTVQ